MITLSSCLNLSFLKVHSWSKSQYQTNGFASVENIQHWAAIVMECLGCLNVVGHPNSLKCPSYDKHHWMIKGGICSSYIMASGYFWNEDHMDIAVRRASRRNVKRMREHSWNEHTNMTLCNELQDRYEMTRKEQFARTFLKNGKKAQFTQ